MSLFETGVEDDTAAMVTEPELATVEQVRLLEGFSYRREAVRKWMREKAETVLRACQKEQRIALRRAAATAKEQEGASGRGQPSEPERLTAAAYVEKVQCEGIDELLIALMYSLHVCTDAELKRLAVYLPRLWRNQS